MATPCLIGPPAPIAGAQPRLVSLLGEAELVVGPQRHPEPGGADARAFKPHCQVCADAGMAVEHARERRTRNAESLGRLGNLDAQRYQHVFAQQLAWMTRLLHHWDSVIQHSGRYSPPFCRL